MLAPSAFLASAADTLPIQEAILSASVAGANETVELSGQHDRTLRPVQAHITSLERSGHNRRL